MSSAIPVLAREHLERVRAFYDTAPTEPQAGARAYRALLAHYYNLLIPRDASILQVGCGDGELLSHLRAAKITPIEAMKAE